MNGWTDRPSNRRTVGQTFLPTCPQILSCIFMVIYLSMGTDWDKLQNILLLQHGEICIIAYGTLFIQEPLLQKHIKFRSNAMRCK